MLDTAGQRAAKAASKTDSSISDLEDLFRQAKEAREPFTPDWYLNTAFYVGQQWLYWNHSFLDKPNLAKWRETIIDNRILPIVTARAARKVKNRPTFIATPFTGDESDVSAARITEKVMEADWLYLGLQQKLFQAVLYADIVCAGFWKVYWDSTLGDSAEFVFRDGRPVKDAEDRPVKAERLKELFPEAAPEGLETKTMALGDACVDVVSPFHLYPDPLATSMAEVEWIMEEKVRSPDYVRQRYDVALEPDTEAAVGPAESRMFGSVMEGGTTYKGIKVYEFWAEPSSTYPQGKKVAYAQNEVLSEDDAPHDPNPYVMFSGVKVPNRFWPTAITSQLRGPQIGLNKVKSQIQENANRIGNPALMKSRQANVYYSGLPGEELLYDSTVTDAVPQYLVPPDMPSYVREQVEGYENALTEISGMHEVSKATVPTGVTAASAINLLQEADDTRIGPEIQDMEASLGIAGTKLARLRAQFNSDERTLRIAGEDGNWDITAFRGAMMGKEPTVECQAGSAMPRSKAAKQAAMLEVLQTALQYGLQFDPRDLRRFFKDYEVGALDRLFGGLSQTEQQVQRENRLLSQGQPVPINAFDVDQDHVEGHEEYQRTARYQQVPEGAKALFEQHVKAHRERIVGMVNNQLGAEATEQQSQAQAEQEREMGTQAHEAALDVAKAQAIPQNGNG